MTPVEMVRFVYGNDIPSCILVATSVLMDNAIIDSFSTKEMEMWLELAKNIQNAMQSSDEPRFTLYDYLDACLNGSSYQWMDMYDIMKKYPTESAFQTILMHTEHKRKIYSTEVNNEK